MTGAELVFEREIDLPPAIVWDALVDPVLLEGWLGAVTTAAAEGDSFGVRWLDGSEPSPTTGVIEVLERNSGMRFTTDNRGTFDVRLEEREGGSRGTGTVLSLRVLVPVDRQFAGPLRSGLETVLDRLEELLRGHPVDWARWQGKPPADGDAQRNGTAL